ncbi:ABC transporter ATP-binding protein [Comamonas aquatica]|uniref:ABC transporter ATP-binding protein n=1 Tax=Comamonas aquatica TaxID=225991 RepID=UPI0024469BF6|nr:ABC transporter ATP-binding protein [Comamonas aquatica]MDH0201042.1 ABC transporter ATP-binding protein [Comamonas aquatica]MDH1447531.1 ABC transporter ATP-binding protein [Comamonas aquatica]MDH1766791.1 ABC transporter ATP-binding protein [Comamonas aquatica]
MATPVLQVRNLTTRFKTERGVVTAVDNVSFEVAAGETLAIVGESGSGKSVTSMSILRLIPSPPGRIENGEILFDGKDLLKLNEDEMRAIRGDRIAMIFQDSMSSLNPSITIGKQIAEPITLHRNASWNEAYEKARDLLSMVQIPDAQSRLSVYPHQFSGGMRQRSMIAMALACQPKLIIADEPTTALDVTVQAQILDLLKDLTQKAQTSMILITHDMGVVARYADRVAVMYGGRIVEQGPAREIFNRPAHPYTQGLLASIPRIDSDPSQPLPAIEGMPPDLSALPVGCAFAPRCPKATRECEASRPALAKVSEGHLKACFNT